MEKRLVCVFCAICILFTGLYLRIGSIMRNDFYIETGKAQSSYTLSLPTERGGIYDCNFSPLVNQDYYYLAAVLPTEENYDVIETHTVGLNQSQLKQLYQAQKPFLCQVNTYQITAPNVQVFPIHQRYSENFSASHLIGYLDQNSKKGLSGLEKSYEDLLTEGARAPQITYTLDGIGHGLKDIEPKIDYGALPQSGIVLTIDQKIQAICEKIGSKYLKKGAVVVMEPATGKLKAVCSFPSFSMETLSQDVADTENSPMLNRAFMPFSVGSTFKIVTAATALTEGISPSETYTCTGGYQLQEQVFHCHYRQGHGTLDMKQAMMLSCNPYFINLGLKLNPGSLLNMANDLSFGKQYELAPNLYTQSGALPKAEDLTQPGQIANLSFGQGALTATPVQLAQMISAVINGGVTPTPILVEGITQDGKTVNFPAESSGIQALSPSVAATLKEELIACVMEREGQHAKPSNVTAGGKTATAQTGIYQNKKELCNGWFAGFFPAETPKYTVVVLTEEAESGNEDASPIFREIAEAITILEKK